MTSIPSLYLKLENRSGRVISLGRLILAALFLLAVWLDSSLPAKAPSQTYAMLGFYLVVSLVVAIITWNDWWMDARLSASMHVVDFIVFTVLVLSTEGYTSPYFLFFVFLLLTATIRWGWRVTALTAAILIALYLAAGLVVADNPLFDMQRFVIRSGHLVILSAILIWFAINQRFAGGTVADLPLEPAGPGTSPLDATLQSVMNTMHARRGLLLWEEDDVGKAAAIGMEVPEHGEGCDFLLRDPGAPFLYDIDRDRTLSRWPSQRFRLGRSGEMLFASAARRCGLTEGLAIPLRSETGLGELYLEGIDSLASDHVELGRQLALRVSTLLRSYSLLRAVEESGEARARLVLARDLHDNIVQFLAGATFRIEAMLRGSRSGEPVEDELGALKRLMLHEQDDLRSFIGSLRSGRAVAYRQLGEELETLAGKLSRQWDTNCLLTIDKSERMLPMRAYLDCLQIVREGVANAVRHGSASEVRIAISESAGVLSLTIADNGRGFCETLAGADADDMEPRTLTERVHDAGGRIAVTSGGAGTAVHISLPVSGA